MRNFLNGKQRETWVATDKNNNLAGIASIAGEFGYAYQEITIRTHPRWQGYLERPLLAKLIRRLKQNSSRHVRIHHPDKDQAMNQLLKEANFSQKRTLTHMRWNVTYDKTLI